MAGVVEKQVLWKRSCRWLDTEDTKARGKDDIWEKVQLARKQLSSLGWDIQMQYQRGMVSSSVLSTLLSTAWLGDEHINMMMEELAARLALRPELASKVIIAPLAFQIQINHNAKVKTYTKHNSRLLHRYQKRIEEGIERIYFPVNINSEHWITGVIDIPHGSIGFGACHSSKTSACGLIAFIGDPLSPLYGPPSKFVRNLQRWLRDAVGVSCVNNGDCLEHGIQTDWFSCGVILPNTISRNVFGDSVWIPRRAVSDRIEWFLKLVNGAKAQRNVPGSDHCESQVCEFASVQALG